MKNELVFVDLLDGFVSIDEAIAYPDLYLQSPPDTEHWMKKLIWCWEILRARIKTGVRLDIKTLGLIKRTKMAIEGVAKEFGIKDTGEEDYTSTTEPEAPKFNHPAERQFYDWYQQDTTSPKSDLAASDPEATLNKLYPDVVHLYNDLKVSSSRDIYWKRWIQKVAGRNSPKLTLEEQKELLSSKIIPKFVWDFISPDKKWDLSGDMFLDTIADLYSYHNVPMGGRLAQTMPETIFYTLFRVAKQQMLNMSVNIDKVVLFVRRFMPEYEKKFTKTGKVWRIGKFYGEGYYPATKSLDAMENNVVHIITGRKNPVPLYSGVVPYFDACGFQKLISTSLGKREYEDNEQEVWVHSSNAEKMSVVVTVKEFTTSGYVDDKGVKIDWGSLK